MSSETIARLCSAEKPETKADCGMSHIHEKLLDHRELLEVFKQSSDVELYYGNVVKRISSDI